MRTIKKNFLIVFLFIASVSTGVLALSTALRLREFRSPQPQETSALSPQCKITFTINNIAPREIAANPTTALTVSPTAQISLIAQKPSPSPVVIITATPLPTAALKPTSSPKLTPTPTIKQQTIGAPQTTANPTQIPTITPKPTTYLAAGTTLTPTPVTKTTVAPAPQLPVSGTNIPTIGAFLLGFLFLLFGVFLRPTQIEVGAKEQRKR